LDVSPGLLWGERCDLVGCQRAMDAELLNVLSDEPRGGGLDLRQPNLWLLWLLRLFGGPLGRLLCGLLLCRRFVRLLVEQAHAPCGQTLFGFNNRPLVINLAGILQMNPEPSWTFVLLPRSGKTAWRRGRLPSSLAPRTATEGLIWPF
jgi:hypothetical protein